MNDTIKVKVILTVEVSRDDWLRHNPGESDAHIRAFVHENARVAVDEFAIPGEIEHRVENVNFPKRGWHR